LSYEPYGKTKLILDRAFEHIQSVEYQVSVRWVFYRLLQEGHYKKKSDYVKFVSLTSRARKNWYAEWTPETLADDTRSMDVFFSEGVEPNPDIDELIEEQREEAKEEIEWHRDQAENYVHRFMYEIDPNYYQDAFCVVMFEARAMHAQFQRYARGLTLCPFGGQPSIPYKWQIAKHIEEQCAKYEKDAVVLYFGDLDDAGLSIFESAQEDIAEWCEADIEFVRCGLTEDQVAKYEIPQNFEHPGYQWEALTDAHAKEIIEGSLRQWYDVDAPRRAIEEAHEIMFKVNSAVNDSLSAEEDEE
jgi:hypothetical protein